MNVLVVDSFQSELFAGRSQIAFLVKVTSKSTRGRNTWCVLICQKTVDSKIKFSLCNKIRVAYVFLQDYSFIMT